MNILPVNNDWRIIVEDEFNFTMQKRMIRAKDNKEYWVNKGYFGQIDHAYKWCTEKAIKDVFGDMTELRNHVAEIYKSIDSNFILLKKMLKDA